MLKPLIWLTTMDKLEVFTDGGARNNPGPAALGVVIGNKEYSQYLGEATNNEAEYQAIIFALKKSKQLLGKEKLANTKIIINSDSELVVKQLNGQYKILEPELGKLFITVWNLRLDFPNLVFNLIPREENKRADRLVNEALDERSSSLF